jgi:hypothetical protein
MIIQQLKNGIETIKDYCWEIESDLSPTLIEVEDGIEKIQSPEFIIEWFENPFISDYDKKKVMEYLNKKP